MTPPKKPRIQIETEVREAWYQKFKDKPDFDAEDPTPEYEWEEYKMLAEALGPDSFEAKWVKEAENMTPEQMQAYQNMLQQVADALGTANTESEPQ